MAPRCLLPFFVLLLGLVTVQSVIYELKGQQVHFDPDITEQPKEILWKHNGNKVVEFNGKEEQVYVSYEDRISLDWDSAQLQIYDLRFEDSGEYECEIYMDRFLLRKTYELEVIEKVPKPIITCQMNYSSSSDMSAVLLCSVELNQTQFSRFKWSSKENVQRGPQLTIFLGGKLDREEYTCRVSNPVSYETATFRAKDCYTVTVQSVKYQLKGQQVQFDPDISGLPDEILWKHNGNKVVKLNGNKEEVYGSFKGRVTLDWQSAQLQISDLCIEDSGEYKSEIYMNRNLLHRSYELEVLEKVPKPTITCQKNSSSSVMSAVLLCSVDVSQTQSSLKFKWISKENVQRGPQLTIFLGRKLDKEEYTCRVSNPASYETATFRAKDCYTGLSAGMIALIVIAVTCCVGLVLFYVLKNKVSKKKTVEDDRTSSNINQASQDSETDHRGSRSNVGGVPSPTAQPLLLQTANSPNLTSQGTTVEHNKDVINSDSDSDSSL